MLKNSPTQWGTIAKLFHWGIGLTIIGMLGFGIYLAEVDLPPMERYGLVLTHKAVGISVLFFVILRVIWRMVTAAPKLPEESPWWEVAAAHLVHYGLYILMFAMPLSGWLMSSAAGYPVTVWGIEKYLGFENGLPALVGKDESLLKLAKALHFYIGYLMIGVILLHVGAALKHHILDKDMILKRMLPFAKVGDSK